MTLLPEEWDALPWWQQQMYLEGFTEEEPPLLVIREGVTDPTMKSEKVHQSGGTTITEREHSTTFSGTPGELGWLGITEQTL